MGLISKKRQRELIKAGCDLEFMKRTQAAGNIDFRPDRYFVAGDGYHTTLHVYGYPLDGLGNYWLLSLMQIPGTRAFLSVKRESGMMIKKELSKSIEEKGTRISGYAKLTENSTEVKEIQKQLELHNAIENRNIPMGSIYVRVFVAASTQEELFKKVEDIKDGASKFKMTILTGELDLEYKAPFVPPKKQIDLDNHRRGAVIPMRDLAGGYFFNHTKLEDPNGSYFGYTPTNGVVNFDFLKRDDKRTRSFMMISGNPKMGQKTFGWKLNDDLYAKGHYIRNFDTTGQFVEQTRLQGGLVIDLGGNENRINPFQVFPTVTQANGIDVNEEASFDLHIEKLAMMFKTLNPSVTGDDEETFKTVIQDFYVSRGIWVKNPSLHKGKLRATKIHKDEYPVLADFVIYMNDVERQAMTKRTVNPITLQSITRIKNAFSSLLQSHSSIFDGPTQFQDISQEPVVTFDFTSLAANPILYNIQMFSVLSLVSADVLNNGKRCRQLLKQNPRLSEEDLAHYILHIENAQTLMNPKNQRSIALLTDMMEKMGDNFAGAILSVASLQGILFTNAHQTGYDPYVAAVNRIFGLMQYRVFANTAEQDIPLLASALSGSMNQSEIETLPWLRKGQLFMSISGLGNIIFDQQLMAKEAERYGGIQ